jgi:hypothetical protein
MSECDANCILPLGFDAPCMWNQGFVLYIGPGILASAGSIVRKLQSLSLRIVSPAMKIR